jgi:transglutaminase-like putative cysteine protease
MPEDLAPYLAATEFIDLDAPAIQTLARSLQRDSPQSTATALFDWVRDNIHYDPYVAIADRPAHRASAVLLRKRGHCVQKATVLAALARSSGIPTRLGFADVRNHKAPQKMLDLLGTNLFVFHGYVEFFLDGHWVKATPAFDAEVSRRAGVLPV